MSNVILNVTLNETEGYLDVDQSGNGNQIPHGEYDTITWQLTGNAASGTFNDQSSTDPGFQWIQDPPGGVFGIADPDGKQLTIEDNNTDPNGINSTGTWVYQLYATINGIPYSTQASNPRGVTNNPTIQNM